MDKYKIINDTYCGLLDQNFERVLKMLEVFKVTYKFIHPQDSNSNNIEGFIKCKDFIDF